MRFIFLFVLLFFCLPAQAAEMGEDLKTRVEKYLNGLTTFSADFTQVDSEGTASGGKFLLKKPGKFKWEYDERQPILIVSDGSQLVYFDKKLKETSYVSAKDTLASFLARKDIKLSGDIKLLAIDDSNGKVIAKVAQRDKPDQGALAMFFDDKDMKISNMEVTDANGYVTKIAFTNQQAGTEIADKNFIFHDPKYSGNAWEKN